MSNVIIKNINNQYDNDSCIANVINYIYRTKSTPLPIRCYGTWPPTYENIIHCFEQTSYSQSPDNQCNEYIWHFMLSFPEEYKPLPVSIRNFADEISRLFSNTYPVCYALHKDTANHHFHFVVSRASYILNNPPITDTIQKRYMSQILKIAKMHNIPLVWKEDFHV